jgi:hypothetical protein
MYTPLILGKTPGSSEATHTTKAASDKGTIPSKNIQQYQQKVNQPLPTILSRLRALTHDSQNCLRSYSFGTCSKGPVSVRYSIVETEGNLESTVYDFWTGISENLSGGPSRLHLVRDNFDGSLPRRPTCLGILTRRFEGCWIGLNDAALEQHQISPRQNPESGEFGRKGYMHSFLRFSRYIRPIVLRPTNTQILLTKRAAMSRASYSAPPRVLQRVESSK